MSCQGENFETEKNNLLVVQENCHRFAVAPYSAFVTVTK